MIRHLSNLSNSRLVLWCYFIWYSVILVRYFDASPRLWLTSLGLSLIIGFALFISTTASRPVEFGVLLLHGASENRVTLDRWQTIRLFLMPFCVSSFSALVKDKGFVLIFSPRLAEIGVAVLLCALLCGVTVILRRQKISSG